MKPIHFILPAAAVLLNAGYLYWQSANAEALRGETAGIREVLRTVAESEPAIPPPETADGEAIAAGSAEKLLPEGEETGEFDLAALAKAIKEAKGNRMPDIRSMLKFQNALMAMSPDELSGLMAEVQTLEVPAETRLDLLGTIADLLAESDPEAAVRALSSAGVEMRDAIQKNPWRLTNVVERWAKKDAAAAAAWLDERTAAGYFEVKGLQDSNSARNGIESAILAELLESDVVGARARLDALTDSERQAVLSDSHRVANNEETRGEWVTLVREYLPEDQRAGAWNGLVHFLTRDGTMEKVTGFLEEIDASPVERRGIALAAVRGAMANAGGGDVPTPESAAGFRQWLADTVPGESDEVLGETLGGLWRGETKDISALVAELNTANPSDDLLASYIESRSSRRGSKGLEELASKISDPERKRAVLEKLKAP